MAAKQPAESINYDSGCSNVQKVRTGVDIDNLSESGGSVLQRLRRFYKSLGFKVGTIWLYDVENASWKLAGVSLGKNKHLMFFLGNKRTLQMANLPKLKKKSEVQLNNNNIL